MAKTERTTIQLEIALPAYLHTRVKMSAASQRRTLKAYVIKTLAQQVEDEKSGKR